MGILKKQTDNVTPLPPEVLTPIGFDTVTLEAYTVYDDRTKNTLGILFKYPYMNWTFSPRIGLAYGLTDFKSIAKFFEEFVQTHSEGQKERA